jgi:integrase
MTYDEALPTTWTREDLGRFVDEVSEDRFLALWLLAATSGMSVGTLVELRRHDIDLETERVHPSTRPGTHADYALDPGAADALRAHVMNWDKEGDTLGHTTDKLFVWSNGQQLDSGSAMRMFRQHCANAGLPLVPLKEVRAAYVVNALEYGIPTEVLTERLGPIAKPARHREVDTPTVTAIRRTQPRHSRSLS